MSSPQKPLNHNEKPADQPRSWAENMFKHMIAGSLGGSVVGCVKGIIEGSFEAAKARETMKLGVKKILGRSLRTGGGMAGNAVFLGIVYASLESGMASLETGMVAVNDTKDGLNCAVAGFGTGAIYKALEPAAVAPRSMVKAGIIGEITAVAAYRWKEDIERYMPIITTFDGWEKKRWNLFTK